MEESKLKKLESLKAKCLKKDGTPRKDADTADLELLNELLQELEAENPVEEDAPELVPLTDEEEIELAELEARAKTGRDHPSPTEMVRLAGLRKRAACK
jgi:hypothetical protein